MPRIRNTEYIKSNHLTDVKLIDCFVCCRAMQYESLRNNVVVLKLRDAVCDIMILDEKLCLVI